MKTNEIYIIRTSENMKILHKNMYDYADNLETRQSLMNKNNDDSCITN